MEVVIFCGIQGSGKTTFFLEHFFATHVRISLDLLKTRDRERAFVQVCLMTGQRCVIDNTNVRAAERAIYIAVARDVHFRVRGYFFESPLRDAIRRNAQRAGAAVIPVPGVIGTFKRMERPTPDEGFDELNIVTHGDDGKFVVSPWTAPVVETPQ
jgi:predicted kinase